MPVISKITGAPFRFWCQKILPAVYDDSLSYYELLCKVVDYLNKVMEDDINVVNLVNELEEFVNNYFNNLDVQQEINNKLDTMAEDGSLLTVVEPYIDDIFAEYKESLDADIAEFKDGVNDTLTEQDEDIANFKETVNGHLSEQDSDITEQNNNINNFTETTQSMVGAQNTRISVLESRMDKFSSLPDGSLSTSADAELVDIRVANNGKIYSTAGDSVRGQNDNVIKTVESFGDDSILRFVPAYENGGISDQTGEPNNDGDAAKVRTINYIPRIYVSNIAINSTTPFIVYLFKYDSAYAYTGRNTFASTVKNIEVPSDCVFFKFVVMDYTDQSWMNPISPATVETYFELYKNGNIINIAKRDSNIVRGWRTLEGSLQPNDDNYASYIIKLNKTKALTFTNAATSNQYLNYLYFADENGGLLSEGARSNTGNSIDVVQTTDYPSSAYYAVITYDKANRYKAKIENGDLTQIAPNNSLEVLGKISQIKPMLSNIERGWLTVVGNYERPDDDGFARITVKLNKTQPLTFANAATSNQYFNYLLFADEHGNYISDGARTNTGNSSDTVLAAEYPTDAYYAVITFARAKIKDAEIVNGNITQFAPNDSLKIFSKINEIAPASAEIIMPSTITAIVGDTLQIYYDSIVNSTEPVEVEFLGTKGHDYPRYFEYTPSVSDVGQTTLTVNVYKQTDIAHSKATLLATKTVTLITKNAPSNPQTAKNILCVGDSTIVGGTFMGELVNRLCSTSGLSLSNIKFKGRLNKTTAGITFGYEGLSGWTWGTYTSSAVKAIRFTVTGVNNLDFESVYRDVNGCTYNISEINVTDGSGNIRCLYTMGSATTTPPETGMLTRISGSGDLSIDYTGISVENYSPFYVEGQVDFEPYVNEYLDGSIDYLVINLGTNSIVNSSLEFNDIKQTILSQMTTFVETFHTQYPNAKVLISTLQKGSEKGGFGANFGSAYNANSHFYNRKVYQLNKLYIEFATAHSEYVELVNVSGEFDAPYDYPHVMKDVNIRDTVDKEMIDTNFGHPSQIGYFQIADALYRKICGML